MFVCVDICRLPTIYELRSVKFISSLVPIVYKHPKFLSHGQRRQSWIHFTYLITALFTRQISLLSLIDHRLIFVHADHLNDLQIQKKRTWADRNQLYSTSTVAMHQLTPAIAFISAVVNGYGVIIRWNEQSLWKAGEQWRGQLFEKKYNRSFKNKQSNKAKSQWCNTVRWIPSFIHSVGSTCTSTSTNIISILF